MNAPGPFLASFAAFLFLASQTQALAQWRGYVGWHTGPGMMGSGYGMGWLGTILMATFWIAVIVGIVPQVRWLAVSTGAGGCRTISENSPLEILKRRHARREINKEEFDEKRKDLAF